MIQNIAEELALYKADLENWLVSTGMDYKLLTATAVGWKVADIDEFMQATNTLLTLSSQTHIADVNDRKIGSFVMNQRLPLDIKIVKLMQRRQGSNDKLGLDHVDFTVTDLATCEAFLKKMNVTYEWQSNDMHRWISARIINNQEAKFIDHTVLDVGAAEMVQASRELMA